MTTKSRPDRHLGQKRAFIEMARAVGCSDDEVAFDEQLRKIAAAEAGHGKVAGDQGEGGAPKATALARKGE